MIKGSEPPLPPQLPVNLFTGSLIFGNQVFNTDISPSKFLPHE